MVKTNRKLLAVHGWLVSQRLLSVTVDDLYHASSTHDALARIEDFLSVRTTRGDKLKVTLCQFLDSREAYGVFQVIDVKRMGACG